MRINLRIETEQEVRASFAGNQYASRKPLFETVTLAAIDGEMDRATLAATLRAIAEGIER